MILVKKEYEEIHKKFNEEAISSYHVIISNLEEIYENCKRNKKIYYQDIMPTVKKVIEFYKKQKKFLSNILEFLSFLQTITLFIQ